MLKGLRGKMITMVVVIILFCTAALSLISYKLASGILTGKMEANYSMAAERYSNELEAWINKKAAIIDTMAAELSTNEMTIGDADTFHKYLENNFTLLNGDGAIYDIYFTNLDNIMVCASDYISDGTVDYAHEREWFTKAVETKELFYSAPYMDVDSKLPVITISKAVYKNGDLKGVLCADIFVDTLVDIISGAEVAENSYAFLVDQNLGMVVHPDEQFAFDDEPYAIHDIVGNLYDEVVENVRAGSESMTYVKDYDGVVRGIVVTKMPSTNWHVGVATQKAQIKKEAGKLLGGFAFAAIISVIAGVLISLFFTATLMTNINKLGRIVAKGDISKDIEVNSKDEIGVLSSDFNMMMHKLRDVVTGVVEVSEGMNGTAIGLKENLADIDQAVEETKNAMANVSVKMADQVEAVHSGRASLDEFREKTGTFGKSFSDLREAADTLEKEAQNNRSIVEKLKNNTAESAVKINEFSDMIQLINNNSSQIIQIVETINNIADQTDLLALNASIEAARAGEAGKGFAVVADEIRKLSEQTNNSVENISEITNGIVSGMQQISQAVEQVGGLFAENQDSAKEAEEWFNQLTGSLDEIYANVTSLSDEMQRVMRAEATVENSLKQIDENAMQCNDMIKLTDEAVTKQIDRARDISHQAEELTMMADALHEKAEGFVV